jgi:excisionase family DNA binding protein
MKGTMRISEFAKRVGLHPQTVRAMVKRGEIQPYITPSGQYRFTEEHVNQVLGIRKKKNGKVVIYARVSTQKQKSYLENQINVCKQFLVSKGLQIDEIITDTASSFNFKRKGLNKLLDMSFGGEIKVICIYSKDRLSRVAYDLFEQILKRLGIEILIVDNSEKLTSDEQLRDAVEEMISFIHYITSKIYGSRSYKKKKIEKCIREVINAPDNEHSNEKEERNQ